MNKDKVVTLHAFAKLLVDALELEGITIIAIDAEGGHSVGAFPPNDVDACRALAKQLRRCADRVDPVPEPWTTT